MGIFYAASKGLCEILLMCFIFHRSVKWNRVFDKMSQNIECNSWTRCVLKTQTPAPYDDEMEHNILSRHRLFAVRLTSGELNFLATASVELRLTVISASLKDGFTFPIYALKPTNCDNSKVQLLLSPGVSLLPTSHTPHALLWVPSSEVSLPIITASLWMCCDGFCYAVLNVHGGVQPTLMG